MKNADFYCPRTRARTPANILREGPAHGEAAEPQSVNVSGGARVQGTLVSPDGPAPTKC